MVSLVNHNQCDDHYLIDYQDKSRDWGDHDKVRTNSVKLHCDRNNRSSQVSGDMLLDCSRGCDWCVCAGQARRRPPVLPRGELLRVQQTPGPAGQQQGQPQQPPQQLGQQQQPPPQQQQQQQQPPQQRHGGRGQRAGLGHVPGPGPHHRVRLQHRRRHAHQRGRGGVRRQGGAQLHPPGRGSQSLCCNLQNISTSGNNLDMPSTCS